MGIATTVFWRLFVDTGKSAFAEKVLKEIVKQIGEVQLIKKEAYWKDKALYELEFEQLIQAEDVKELLYQILRKAALISNSWQLSLPSGLHTNHDEISGITEGSFKVHSLKWGSFIINQ